MRFSQLLIASAFFPRTLHYRLARLRREIHSQISEIILVLIKSMGAGNLLRKIFCFYLSSIASRPTVPDFQNSSSYYSFCGTEIKRNCSEPTYLQQRVTFNAVREGTFSCRRCSGDFYAHSSQVRGKYLCLGDVHGNAIPFVYS